MIDLLLSCSLQADEAAAVELQRQQNDAAERRHFEALQSTYGMTGKVLHILLEWTCCKDVYSSAGHLQAVTDGLNC